MVFDGGQDGAFPSMSMTQFSVFGWLRGQMLSESLLCVLKNFITIFIHYPANGNVISKEDAEGIQKVKNVAIRYIHRYDSGLSSLIIEMTPTCFQWKLPEGV